MKDFGLNWDLEFGLRLFNSFHLFHKKLEHNVNHPTNSYYVLTEDNQVYICLQQGKSVTGTANASTVKPTGTVAKPFKTADGYVWKFLFSLSAARSSKFLSSNLRLSWFDNAITSNIL